MSARRIRSLALALALLWTTSTLASARAQQPAQRLESVVAIPFELANNVIHVQVSVEGAPPAWFVLDTGDRYALIDLALAQSLGLELGGRIDVRGTGPGTLPGHFVKRGSFRLVGLEGFSQPLFLALSLETLAAAGGHAFSGILGHDFLIQFVVEIDYQERVLRLHDRESFVAPAELESLALDFDAERHPTVQARIRVASRAPLDGTFVLDTGASEALTLKAPFVERERLLASVGETVPCLTGYGVGGAAGGVAGRIEELLLGRTSLPRPVAVLSTATSGAHASRAAAGAIGGGLLKKFRVFLDYGRARLLLEPNESFAEPLEHDMSGLRLLAEGAGYRTFRVLDVSAPSPAAAADLRAGDLLSSVDGRPAAELTLSEIRERFRREGPCRLVVERGGERLELELALRRRV